MEVSPAAPPGGGRCVPTTLPPLTHVLQGAADGVGPLAPPQVPGEAEVGEFEVPCGVRWRVGAPNDGVSPRMGCPHPSATAPYPSHPGGCSPSETNQALGWPICTRGCKDPPPTILCPPPKPLCHPPSRLCARCPGRGDTLGTRRSHQSLGTLPHAVPSATPVAPSGRLPPPRRAEPPPVLTQHQHQLGSKQADGGLGEAPGGAPQRVQVPGAAVGAHCQDTAPAS